MTIKKFVEEYSKRAAQLNEQYLKDNLKITTYVPFIEKVSYATTLAHNTMVDKETGNIRVSSESNYLFFCRSVVELYTNLEIENKSFYEEYDLLNESGVLDMIMQMIPERELKEFKLLCDMKKNDIITNYYETHSFISNQVTRFGELIGITLKPVMDKISEQLKNMSDEDVEKIKEKANDFLEVVK